MFKFLKLLAAPQQRRRNTRFIPMTEKGWIEEVKKAKKRSVSLIFSRRACAVCKCTLTSMRVMVTLINFYSTLIRELRCVTRWLSIVEAKVEKGKELIVRRLRNVTLIEGHLQMTEDRELIEWDDCFSTLNYRLHKNYSIETAMLEKRLMISNSLIEMKPAIYRRVDLQSCYDM